LGITNNKFNKNLTIKTFCIDFCNSSITKL
jgi:hypothetical protein